MFKTSRDVATILKTVNQSTISKRLTDKKDCTTFITPLPILNNSGNKLSTISARLSSGAELTPEELDYLRQNNPELYERAMQISLERKAFKKALQSCKTKQQAHNLLLSKTIIAAKSVGISIAPAGGVSDSGAGSSTLAPDDTALLNAFQDEFTKFIQSPYYKKLPREVVKAIKDCYSSDQSSKTKNNVVKYRRHIFY